GEPTLISGGTNLVFVEEDEQYILTIDVTNVKVNDLVQLKVTKKVEGNFGNKAKQFEFVLTIGDGSDTTTEYEWTLNGEKQDSKIKNNDTFSLSHGDSVQIVLPKGTEVTISEDGDGYEQEFKLGDAEGVSADSKKFTVSEDTELEVINTYDGIVPTGVYMGVMVLLVMAGALLLGIIILGYRRRKSFGSR
nr:DUF5979 domain-containing protein [Eubacterium sp.]